MCVHGPIDQRLRVDLHQVQNLTGCSRFSRIVRQSQTLLYTLNYIITLTRLRNLYVGY